MAQKIIRLSESVINQIAAGEVVENPASIVKELIENSLDAGSKHISISIRGGGQLGIEIVDDGCGMSPEDAALSIERHATSKIRAAEDLATLATMGFRGEAIAAIASVSHFELRTSDGKVGTEIRVKGGVVEMMQPCARNQGTTVVVRSLFYNVPARKKFQKSIAANTAQVTKIVEIMSAANPEVSFSYTSQDERIYHLSKQSKRERIESLFGPFRHEEQSPHFWGLFCAPEEAKSHRKGQFLFINRRPVFSPLIAKAVQSGYGTRLSEHMYPSFVLFLEMDPSLVDVNVHPQKKEVRFSDESALFSQVERFVAKMFTSQQEGSVFRFFEPLSFKAPPSFPFREEVSFPSVEAPSLPFEIPARPLFVLGRYFFMEMDGVFLIDLHGARARICFEEMKEGTGEREALLWPLELEEEDPDVLDALQKMGIECRWIGEKKIAVDALPASMDAAEFPQFFALWKKEGKRLDVASVRFSSRKFSLDEAMHLWRRLQKCQDRLYDPLGRKIWKKLEQGHLETCLSKE